MARNTTDKKRQVDPLTAETFIGTHEDCGGEVFFKMDNPAGTYECKRCNKRARAYELARCNFVIIRPRFK